MMLTTGILMFGKISVGVRTIASAPMMRMSMDTTTKVYGRRNASRTIHIQFVPCVSTTGRGLLAACDLCLCHFLLGSFPDHDRLQMQTSLQTTQHLTWLSIFLDARYLGDQPNASDLMRKCPSAGQAVSIWTGRGSQLVLSDTQNHRV